MQDRRIITGGLNEQADIQATHITTNGFAQEFDVICRDRQTGTQRSSQTFICLWRGHMTVKMHMAIAGLNTRRTGTNPRGIVRLWLVQRRFSHIGKVRDVDIFDDCAHHPVEIAAVLGSAREAAGGRVTVLRSRIAIRGCVIYSPISVTV